MGMDGLNTFMAMHDIVKALKDTNDATLRSRAVIELQEKILSAQDAQTALIQRVRDLEAQLTEKLMDFGGGTLARSLKPPGTKGAFPIQICAACDERGLKSILQNAGGTWQGRQKFECPECKTEYLRLHARSASCVSCYSVVIT